MQWKTNLTNDLMMLNQPVTFIGSEENKPTIRFQMRIPTIKEVYGNTDLQFFSSIIHTSIEKLQNQFTFLKNLSTHFQLFKFMLIYKNYGLSIYIDSFVNTMNLLGVPVKIENNTYKINDLEIEYNLFQTIQDTILILIGTQKVDNYASVDPRYAAMKERINKIRQNGKNQINNKSNLSETFVVLTYEFGFKPEEIYNLNVYQMNTYMSYVNKTIQYKISVISAGNGLSKKVKYITHKGK